MRNLEKYQMLKKQSVHPYFHDALRSNDNGRSSSQSLFVEDPPTLHHPTHKDSDSLFFHLMRLSRKQEFFQKIRSVQKKAVKTVIKIEASIAQIKREQT